MSDPAADSPALQPPAPHPYVYPAKLDRVVDGDTIYVHLDLGHYVWRKHVDLRLRGVNAPEMHGSSKSAGEKSKAFVQKTLRGARGIIIQTFKDQTGKYGRLLADVWYRLPDGATWRLLNQELLDQGLAVPFEGPVIK